MPAFPLHLGEGTCMTHCLVLRTAIAPPVWWGGAPAILLVSLAEKLVENLRRAPLEAHEVGFVCFRPCRSAYSVGPCSHCGASSPCCA